MPCTVLGAGNTKVKKISISTFIVLNCLVWEDRSKM